MATPDAVRSIQVAETARHMGLEPMELNVAAYAIWSNLNPQTVPFVNALSVAAAALAAVKVVREALA